MKIKRIEACNVFGYINFDIEFNSDLTFLTGINGSGKTTIIRLILALVTPSLRELDEIEHEYALLHIESNNKNFIIKSESNENSISIKVSGIAKSLSFEKIDRDRFSDRPDAEDRIEEHYSILEENLSNHQIIKFLAKIETPTFLGLERRQNKRIPLPQRFFRPSTSRHISNQIRRGPFRGTLGASLVEIQGLVQDFYRDIRIKFDKINAKLKEDIWSSPAFIDTQMVPFFANS